MAIIIEQNYVDTCNRLKQSVQNGMKLPASVEVVASMCAGGVATTVYNWLKKGRAVCLTLPTLSGNHTCKAPGIWG